MPASNRFVGFEFRGIIAGQQVEGSYEEQRLTISPLLRRRAELLVEAKVQLGTARDRRAASLDGEIGTVLATIIRACDRCDRCVILIGDENGQARRRASLHITPTAFRTDIRAVGN